jgi:hypothetical protein
MSPVPLHPISLTASLESHRNDNLTPSPPRKGSGSLKFSPADCCTLKKILSDMGTDSPPSTPSPVELRDQPFVHSGRTSSTVNDRPAEEVDRYQLVGDEAETGYEDEDDSMELSEDGEDDTVEDVMNLPSRHASPGTPYHGHSLRDRLLIPNEIEKLKQSNCRPSNESYMEPDWLGLPQELGHTQTDRQPISDEIRERNQLRFLMEKVLGAERMDQECTTRKQEPGIFIPSLGASQFTTASLEESDLEAFDADNEGESTTDDTAGAQHMKVREQHLHATVPCMLYYAKDTQTEVRRHCS